MRKWLEGWMFVSSLLFLSKNDMWEVWEFILSEECLLEIVVFFSSTCVAFLFFYLHAVHRSILMLHASCFMLHASWKAPVNRMGREFLCSWSSVADTAWFPSHVHPVETGCNRSREKDREIEWERERRRRSHSFAWECKNGNHGNALAARHGNPRAPDPVITGFEKEFDSLWRPRNSTCALLHCCLRCFSCLLVKKFEFSIISVLFLFT